MEIFAAKATGWLLAACWLAGCWLAAVPGWPLPLASDPTLSHPLAPSRAGLGCETDPTRPKNLKKRCPKITQDMCK
jgi:hypothetical protein